MVASENIYRGGKSQCNNGQIKYGRIKKWQQKTNSHKITSFT